MWFRAWDKFKLQTCSVATLQLLIARLAFTNSPSCMNFTAVPTVPRSWNQLELRIRIYNNQVKNGTDVPY